MTAPRRTSSGRSTMFVSMTARANIQDAEIQRCKEAMHIHTPWIQDKTQPTGNPHSSSVVRERGDNRSNEIETRLHSEPRPNDLNKSFGSSG